MSLNILLESSKNNMPVVWTVSGSDSSAYAGVQSDLKGFDDLLVHACTIITAVTAQNSKQVISVNPVSKQVLQDQIDSLSKELLPSVIKLGLLVNEDLINVVCDFLEKHSEIYVVCDPVIQASSGKKLLEDQALLVFVNRLLPRVNLLTPNIPELEYLSSVCEKSDCEKIVNHQQLKQSAQIILNQGVEAVFVKGGHFENLADHQYFTEDIFFSKNGERLLAAPHAFKLQNTRHEISARGTGCRLASVLAALLAHNYTLEDACVLANAYLNRAINSASLITKNQVSSLLPSVTDISSNDLPSIVCDVSKKHIQRNLYHFPKSKNLGLYPVVDNVSWVEKLARLGVKTIQIRLKNLPMEDVERQIIRAVALQIKYSINLFVNDYWQLAIKHKAYGVHLGQEDLADANVEKIHQAGLYLGLSTHAWWEISRAHTYRPSYIAIGPIYPTQTKKMLWEEQGLERLQKWVKCFSSEYELVAIGGIDADRIADVLETGVESVAVVSAITQAINPQLATEGLLQYFID